MKDVRYLLDEETETHCISRQYIYCKGIFFSVSSVISLLFWRDTKRQFYRMASDPEEIDLWTDRRGKKGQMRADSEKRLENEGSDGGEGGGEVESRSRE